MKKTHLVGVSLVFVAILSIAIFAKAGPAKANWTQIDVTSVDTIQKSVTDDNTFEHGWAWIYNISIPDNETLLKIKFSDLLNTDNPGFKIPAGTNIRFYSEQSSNAYSPETAIIVSGADDYSDPMYVDIAKDMNFNKTQIQLHVYVEARIPQGVEPGAYSTQYAIATYAPDSNRKPVITLVGKQHENFTIGGQYIEHGATVTDGYGIPTTLTISSSSIDANTLGDYQVTYDAVDSLGLHADQVIRTVSVLSPYVSGPVAGSVTLSNLSQTFDSNPKSAGVTTDPLGVGFSVTYDGSPMPPTAVGSYNVVAWITDPSYFGTTTGTLIVNPAPPAGQGSNGNDGGSILPIGGGSNGDDAGSILPTTGGSNGNDAGSILPTQQGSNGNDAGSILPNAQGSNDSSN